MSLTLVDIKELFVQDRKACPPIATHLQNHIEASLLPEAKAREAKRPVHSSYTLADFDPKSEVYACFKNIQDKSGGELVYDDMDHETYPVLSLDVARKSTTAEKKDKEKESKPFSPGKLCVLEGYPSEKMIADAYARGDCVLRMDHIRKTAADDTDAKRAEYLKHAAKRYEVAADIRARLTRGQNVTVIGYSYGCMAAGLNAELGWKWLHAIEADMPVPDHVIVSGLEDEWDEDGVHTNPAWQKRMEMLFVVNELSPAPRLITQILQPRTDKSLTS